MHTLRRRDGAFEFWDLRAIIDFLKGRFSNVSAIYLFGSRAYRTGSARSDIDLLAYSSAEPIDLGIALTLQTAIPPLDLFRTIDMKTAESVVNGSYVRATPPSDLIDQLDAIELWSTTAGLSVSFLDWEQKTHIAAEFVMTVADYPRTLKSKVFIGHGHPDDWKRLMSFLMDKLKLDCDEFTSVSTGGKPTVKRLTEMLDDARFAFLIATAENATADGTLHARENVIHEIGLFQGRLGLERAIILRERECLEFSNILGVGQIVFEHGKIADEFGKIEALLRDSGMITS